MVDFFANGIQLRDCTDGEKEGAGTGHTRGSLEEFSPNDPLKTMPQERQEKRRETHVLGVQPLFLQIWGRLTRLAPPQANLL